jgi:hypothetical protein
MALEAQRPEVRDVFILARTELFQETAHLSRTGMIVLHRRVYTPDLPRAIANTLAIINGGQLNDFRVFQAVLSPLMVIPHSSPLKERNLERFPLLAYYYLSCVEIRLKKCKICYCDILKQWIRGGEV